RPCPGARAMPRRKPRLPPLPRRGGALATGPRGPAPPPPPPPAAPPAAAPFDPERNPLDRYLLRWEEAMKKVDTLALACTRKEIDKVYKSEKVYQGTIHFLKPTYFFWDMRVKGKPQEFERFICSGQYIYQFVPSERVIRVYPAPKVGPHGGIAEDSSIAFLFGMKATEAKQR